MWRCEQRRLVSTGMRPKGPSNLRNALTPFFKISSAITEVTFTKLV
jgi:hypothetical protein